MIIRPATPQDKPAIIELLKKSLGESTIPKSEGLWHWKHEQNPFGASYVLLAEEGNSLIGLRAFMQWRWQWQGKIYDAIRAVDTATHPEHQGKGIFKKLTLQQIEMCKKEGVHFVFNTPNEQSRPGYLKMGWQQQGKMPLKFAVRQPLSLAFAKVFQKNRYTGNTSDPTPLQNWDTKFITTFLKDFTNNNHQQLTTLLSAQYINWRYATNPLFRYHHFTDSQNYLLVARIKHHAFTKELRLVDFLLVNQNADVNKVQQDIKKQVSLYAKQNKASLISLSGVQYELFKPYFKWMGPIPVRAAGPIVTVKDVNMQEHFSQLLQVNNWAYSLGDMELF